MIDFKKLLSVAVIATTFFGEALGINNRRDLFRREASSDCRQAYIIAKTTEKMCFQNLNKISDFSSDILDSLCDSSSGCITKMNNAYENFKSLCSEDDVNYKNMILQHINDLDSIICKKDGSSYCLVKMNEFIESKPKSKDDLDFCESDCIPDIYNTLSKGVVTLTSPLRNDIIRSKSLCSKVPGKSSYCIDKLKKFREENSYERKMDIYCDSLCVQKTLWKNQDEYSNSYFLTDSPETIIANFTDSACLYYNENRCGTLLLKILNNDYGCSGLKHPRIFPFSGNYTLCNTEVSNIIEEYGTCVNSLFGNKGGDWLNLFIEISRYSKTRRLKDYRIFENPTPYGEPFNRTYKINNFNWDWYQSNDRAVSVYIINSIAAHLGITPSMISGQGFSDYSIMINGLTENQWRELDDEHTMGLPMFSGKISVEAMVDQTKGFEIDYGTTILPNMMIISTIALILMLLFINN